MSTSLRKATNLSIDANLIAEAKALNVNVSRAAERGIDDAVRREKARRWQEENAEAIADYNRFVEQNGLLLEHLRPF